MSLLGLSGLAGAQSAGSNNRAAAEALFSEGRALAAKGRFAEACPKFEASQQLDPGLGTVLNLAECYEKLGKTASAWAEYRDAIPLARASGSKVREDLATTRAAALQSRLSTLTIRAPSSAHSARGLEIRRDGTPVLQAELDSAIPVDPGAHTLEASAPGKQPWSTTVQVGADAPNVVVEVPILADAADANANANADTAVAPAAHQPDEPPPKSGSSSQRTVAIVVGAVGVAGLGLGTFFGLKANGSLSDAKEHCLSYPSGCGPEGAELNSTASSQATVATVAFIAGGAALATGAVLWFTAGPRESHGVALGFGPGAAFVTGSFQ